MKPDQSATTKKKDKSIGEEGLQVGVYRFFI
jgi:hypothetical protein